jgi:hypothetical protein
MTRALFAVLLSAVAVSASAQQQSIPPFRMEIVGVADGPFKETRVFKLRDRENATTCYFYVPQHIDVGRTCADGPCVAVIRSEMGSISCVKDAPPSPPPASERKP